jgi:hypothetical protein
MSRRYKGFLSGMIYDKIEPEILSKEELERLEEIFKETDYDERLRFLEIRKEAAKTYDFSGRGHLNVYTWKNYERGVLKAIEETRPSHLPAESSEYIVSSMYAMGYSFKRILYALFKFGYKNWNKESLLRWMDNNRKNLTAAREKFMGELSKAAEQVFQDRKEEVMACERETLNIYLSAAKKLQEQLNKIDVTEEPRVWGRVSNQLADIQRKINAMHGIDGLRSAAIEVSKVKAITREKRKTELGLFDEELKQESSLSAPAIEGGPQGRTIEAHATMLD